MVLRTLCFLMVIQDHHSECFAVLIMLLVLLKEGRLSEGRAGLLMVIQDHHSECFFMLIDGDTRSPFRVLLKEGRLEETKESESAF